MKKLTHLTRISLLLFLMFGLDKGLGIFRQVFMARRFLIPDQDAFNVANNLPDLLSALISGGALAMAFTPVLSSLLTREGRDSAWDIFSRIANLAFIITGSLSLVIALLADWLVSWKFGIAPGLPLERQHLVAELMRLNLGATMIFSISGLVMAGLQANQHFLLPALAPIFYNLGQIFGLVVLAPQTGLRLGPVMLPAFGMGVHGLVYGVILGALLHLFIQVPGLVRYKFTWTPAIGLRHPEVLRSLGLLGPRILTMLFIQLIFVARDNLASGLGEGGISALTYGWMIMQVPETLIGTAIATALLPTLAELVARGEMEKYKQTIERAVQVLLAVCLPLTAVLMMGLGPLVKLVFAGRFSADQLDGLVGVSQAFLLGLAGQSLLEVAVRAFYARKNALLPLAASGINLALFVGLSFLLTGPFGVVGIALAITISYTLEMLLLFFLLNQRLPARLAVGQTLLRGLGAAIIGGGLAWVVLNGLTLPLPAVILSIFALGIGGLAALPLVRKEIRLLVRL